ncbi:hypothetical protein M0813_18431 [Anaeramoeba flamelloides]|uniref:Uncharacterized protein n=1 Tax=Anaeramoeba flamelloides TaxID=1746091 RepID=A0ABQ8YTD9_9EUKA|nr:hypothetical protein M0813_18431 [Anaeramoeba flamelloides]
MMKFVKERKTNTCACSFLLFSFLILAILLSILAYLKSFEQNFSVAENCIVQNRTILKRYQIAPETQSGSDDDSSTSYADSCDLQDTANYIFHFHLNYKAHGKSYENTKAYDWDESCYELRGIGCSQLDCNGTKSDTGTNDIVLPKNETYNLYTIGDVIDCWVSEKNNSLIYINDPSTDVTGFYYV